MLYFNARVLYSAKEIVGINKEIRYIVDKVVRKGNEFINNKFRLEKYLHDSVVKSVAYDYDSLKQNDCYNAHSIVGAFYRPFVLMFNEMQRIGKIVFTDIGKKINLKKL